MSVRMPKRSDLPLHWRPETAVSMSVVSLSFAVVVVLVAPLRIHPHWLTWPLAIGLLVMGLGLGLTVAPMTVRYLWPILVGEALEHRRRRDGGESPAAYPPMPALWRDLYTFGGSMLKESLAWLAAVLMTMGGATGAEFALTADVTGWGAAVSLPGFAIGYFLLPWLWVVSRFER